MSRLTLWLAERQLNSKTPVSRLQAIRKLRALADAECLPLIEQALTNPDVEVRREAVLALGDLHDDQFLPALIRALRDPDESVQLTAIAQLKRTGHRAVIPPLVEKLLTGTESVQWRAAAALEALAWQPKTADEQIKFFIATGKLERLINLGERAVKALVEVLRHAPGERRIAAAGILGEIGEPEVLPPLLRALKDSNAQLRTAVIYALARTRLPEVVPPLLVVLRDGDRNVRVAAAASLGALRDPAAVDSLIALLEDKDWEVRAAALEALGKIRDTRAAESVAQQMEDHDPDVREAAADVLGRVGNDNDIEKLLLTSVDENLGVRQAAIRALQRVDPDWPRSERVQRLLPKLQATLKHKDASVQLAAAGLIQLVTRAQPQTLTLTPVAAPDAEKQKNTTLTRVLEELLRDPDSACRCAAAEAIAELKLALPVDFLALAELKHTTIEQIFLAAYDRELWFQRDCPDPDAIRQLLTEISRRALQLTTLLTLGDFRRLELRHAHARHLVVCGADRNLLVRAASPDSALATLPVPVAHDELPSWLQHEPSVRGALVRTIRFADASVVCDLDSRAFPVTQLETAFRRVHELFTLALPDGTRPDRLAWQFERAHLHCAVRADGALLGIFANSKDADLAGIENQLRQFTVAPIASRAAA